MPTVATLKKRAEFLRLRGGARFATPSFVLETRPRLNVRDVAPAAGPRFGFTVTKKLGKAVVRNRIRRRLKAAVALVAPGRAHSEHDYVLVARPAAFDRAFPDVKKDLERALQRVHHPAAAGKGQGS
ncbi:ribonuclease P protein component [Hyphomicrobium sp.]|uniref:ribonuclease P protein component n=1 Tax=Hyphomicrobium sp. TaxID=82 RepID=UPI002E373C9C|nr:ribonuclease P protein component [Hyphomicrobium sp.]HEX2841424.1 ribonuclease P protein component [Hyphomicrobium sp.]